jgi:hypothetical protein
VLSYRGALREVESDLNDLRVYRGLIMSSVSSMAIHPHENRYNFPGRRLREVGIKVMSFVVIERV